MRRSSNSTGENGMRAEVDLLPAAEVGAAIRGIAHRSLAHLRAEPRHGAELVSQMLLGEEALVLRERGGWLQVQSGDRYVAWVHHRSLDRRVPDDPAEFAPGSSSAASRRSWVVTALGARAISERCLTRPRGDLVQGAIVAVSETRDLRESACRTASRMGRAERDRPAELLGERHVRRPRDPRSRGAVPGPAVSMGRDVGEGVRLLGVRPASVRPPRNVAAARFRSAGCARRAGGPEARLERRCRRRPCVLLRARGRPATHVGILAAGGRSPRLHLAPWRRLGRARLLPPKATTSTEPGWRGSSAAFAGLLCRSLVHAEERYSPQLVCLHATPRPGPAGQAIRSGARIT